MFRSFVLPRITLFLVLLLLAFLMSVGAGCQMVGPAFEQTKEGVSSNDVNPNRLACSDDDGQETTQSTGPVSRTTIAKDGTINAIGGGIPSRELALPGKFYLRSGSDIDTSADEIYDPTTGGLLAKNFRVRTLVSDPQRAANEALPFWERAVQAVTTEQRLALQAQMEEMRKSWEAIAPGMLDLAKGALFPPAVVLP